MQRHILDVQYFDSAFTIEKPQLTPVDKDILASMDQTQFRGFSYTNPNTTDWKTNIEYYQNTYKNEKLPVDAQFVYTETWNLLGFNISFSLFFLEKKWWIWLLPPSSVVNIIYPFKQLFTK